MKSLKAYLDVPLEVSKINGSYINGLFHLLIWLVLSDEQMSNR